MTRRPLSRLLVAATAVLSVAACEEESITLDSGDPSTLQVRVYVDVNGNGVFDAGDEGIASVTVLAAGPAEYSGETDGSGLAVLEGLIPGSYTLSVSGSAPSGAVLATSPRPVVVADFRGGSLSAEFRYGFQPGSISGRLYRDDNDNDQFDADADLAAAGIGVTAERSDGTVVETTTGPDGSYALTGLRPGTYTVSFALPEDAELVGDPFTVDVEPNTAASLEAVFTGELLVSIARARDAAFGQSVTVEGVINWAPDFDGRQIFVQDETAGISVFDFDLADFAPDGLAIGDRVRLTGARGAFDGEVQIGSLTAFEVLSSGAPPVPAQVTAAEIDAGERQGELVSINGTVEQVDVLSFGNQMVLLRDEAGQTFAVKADSRTGVEADAWEVGVLYGVTGVLGTDENESGTDIEDEHPHRVEVRSEDDVQRGGATTSIADARLNAGSSVVVEGVLTFVHPDGRGLYLQDASAGIAVFDFGLGDFEPMGGFQRGQIVRINGTVGSFRGELQIGSLADVEVVEMGAVPSPIGMTGAEINAGENQGELAVATGTVTDIQTFSFDNHMVTLEDAGGTAFSVFVDSRTGLGSADWSVGTRYRVTGVLATDDRNTPAPQLEPRGPEDQVEVAAGAPTSIAEARAMVGETVTIRGVVSRKESWDDRDGWIQDETGGIFSDHGLDGAEAGDVVEVTGTVQEAFGDEIQIEPTVVTVVSSGAAPDPVTVTGAQVNAFFVQGLLVRLTGEVVGVAIINEFGTQLVTILTDDGSEVEVFSDNRTGLAEDDWTLGETVTVVAPVGRFFESAQLEIMHIDDVTFGS